MKKNKLFIEYDFDFDLIGLISSAKEYKLAWHINNLVGVDLAKQSDIEISFVNSTISISNYVCESENCKFRLLKNKSTDLGTQTYLMPELKQFDYLILIEGEGGTFEAKEVTNKLREITVIQYLALIDYAQLKSKENLLF